MMDMNQVRDWIIAGEGAVAVELTSFGFYLQLGIILGGIALAFAVRAAIRARFAPVTAAMGWPGPIRMLVRVGLDSIPIMIFVALMLTARAAMLATTWPSRSYLLPVAAKLGLAWIVIRLVTSVIRNVFLVRLVSISAWFVTALSILGWLSQTTTSLDSVGIVLGGMRVTPLLVIKLTVLLAIALWLSNIAGHFLQSRISQSRDLTPSMQVLLIKLVRLALMVLAVVLAMSAVGIDLSALAFFSGAVGVGIGLGLQKIVANFVSGIVLLVDKSVKPGDLVTIGDSSGRISAMNTRYVSISAGDGREFLVPNEDLVTQKVVNWTYTDNNTLVKVRFGTTYDADPRAVCAMATQIAATTPRVTDLKPPGCLLSEFTDSGMLFSLTFWIADPGGMDSVRSEVMLALWDAFKREGIHVPYPVRDVRIQPGRTPIEAASGQSGRE
jgi:small-conductance mechanosensitive channel